VNFIEDEVGPVRGAVTDAVINPTDRKAEDRQQPKQPRILPPGIRHTVQRPKKQRAGGTGEHADRHGEQDVATETAERGGGLAIEVGSFHSFRERKLSGAVEAESTHGPPGRRRGPETKSHIALLFWKNHGQGKRFQSLPT
jgi:hypothetical protein